MNHRFFELCHSMFAGTGAGRLDPPEVASDAVKTIGNILWLVLAGVWLALGYALAGLVSASPSSASRSACRRSSWPASPCGPSVATVVPRSESGGCLQTVFNVIWLVLFGWEIFLAHLVAGALLCITIIGIPFGLQAFKLSVLALWPFGREVVED